MTWIRSSIGDEESLICLDDVRCVTKERVPSKSYDDTSKNYVYKCWFKNTQVYQAINQVAYNKLVEHLKTHSPYASNKQSDQSSDNYTYLI